MIKALIFNFRELCSVFQEGKAVKDAIGLKNKQLIANALVALLGGLVVLGRSFGIDHHLSDADLLNIGYAIAAVLCVFNTGATVASTTKIGLPPKQPAEPLPTISSDSINTGMQSNITLITPKASKPDDTYFG